MIKTFTLDDLIRFLYHETSEEESREINRALLCDSELQALFNELKTTIKQLDDAQLEPSPSVLLNILSYSRSVGQKAVMMNAPPSMVQGTIASTFSQNCAPRRKFIPRRRTGADPVRPAGRP